MYDAISDRDRDGVAFLWSGDGDIDCGVAGCGEKGR